MKNKTYFFYLFILSLSILGFFACKKSSSESEPSSKISLLNNDGSVASGNFSTLSPGVNFDGGILFNSKDGHTAKSISIEIVKEGDTLVVLSSEKIDLSEEANYKGKSNFKFPVHIESSKVGQFKIIIALRTSNEDVLNATYYISFTNTYISKTWDIVNQNGSRVSPNFWSSGDDNVFLISDLGIKGRLKDQHNKIDIGYVSTKEGNKIISPIAQEATDNYCLVGKKWTDGAVELCKWTSRNTTKFKKATQTTIEEINNIKNGYYDVLISKEQLAGEPNLDAIPVTAKNVIESAAEAKLVFFKTQNGKYGFIIITIASGSVTSDGNSTAGTLKFRAIYQK